MFGNIDYDSCSNKHKLFSEVGTVYNYFGCQAPTDATPGTNSRNMGLAFDGEKRSSSAIHGLGSEGNMTL